MRVQEETGLLGGYGGGGRPKMILYILIATFIAWNILLFILSVVALAKVNNVDSGDNIKNYNLETVARDFEIATEQVLFTDKVVSLLPNGLIRLGAGVTVFPAVGHVAPNLNGNSKYLKVVSFDLPFTGGIRLANSEMIVLSWVDYSTPSAPTAWAVVGVMSISYNTLKMWGTPKQIPNMPIIDDMVRVHQHSVQGKIVLTFCIAGGGKYYIGQTSQDSMDITLSPEQSYDAGAGSNTELAVLSPNHVIFAYYQISEHNSSKHLMEVAACTVNYNPDGSFKDAKMGTPDNYSINKAYHSICPLSSTTFVLSYPSYDILKLNETNNDTLISRLGRIQNDGSISVGPEKALKGASPNFFMASVGLSSKVGVVIFVDQADNYALKAVVVGPPTLTGEITPLESVAYGSLLHLSESPSGGELGNGTFSFIAACAVDKWRFAVAYVDFSNGGRLTTMMVEVDSITQRLALVTPPFVISGPVPDSAKDYWWVTMAPLVTNHQLGYVIIDSLQERATDPGRRNNTIVEVASRPFGLVKSISGTKSTIAVSGVHKFQDSRFKGSVGRVFYATAQGDLVDDVDTGTQPEAYIDAGNVLVSYHSRVGVAISENELLIGA